MIIDICQERMNEFKSLILNKNEHNFKFPLALYNPPDRLKSLQQYIYKQIRKFFAMDKKTLLHLGSQQLVYQNNKNCTSLVYDINNSKKKCIDHIDEILMSELYEEDAKWSNFDLEEQEIINSVSDEIHNEILNEILNTCILIHKKKI